MGQFTLNISNSKDLPDLIFQGGFVVQFILDERHFVEYINTEPDIKEEISEFQGLKKVEKLSYMQQKELSFLIDADGARFISRLKIMDTFTYTDYRGELITPDEWNVEVEPSDSRLDTHYKRVRIKIKLNYFDKYSKQTNFTEVAVVVPTKPVATDVVISGSNTHGSLLTGNYTYVDNGGAEGTSLYKWFRADDSLGTNKQEISGATSHSYIVATADLNKWLFFRVMPVSVIVITDGDWVESAAFVIQNNTVPEAQDVEVDDYTVRVGDTVTGSYVYFDADGDLEGTSLLYWYIADDEFGLNEHIYAYYVDNTVFEPIHEGKYFRFAVVPVAQTGVSPGLKVYSSPYGEILAAL